MNDFLFSVFVLWTILQNIDFDDDEDDFNMDDDNDGMHFIIASTFPLKFISLSTPHPTPPHPLPYGNFTSVSL